MYQGPSGAIQRKELHPSLHLSVVAIEKEVFWLPSTTVANFTYLLTELNVLAKKGDCVKNEYINSFFNVRLQINDSR